MKISSSAATPRSISNGRQRFPLFRTHSWFSIAISLLSINLICTPASSATNSVSADEQFFTRARKDIENPALRAAAERTLLRLAEDRNESLRAQARAALSEFRRGAGRPQEAFALVSGYADLTPENIALPRLPCYLEAALCRIALNESLAAFKMLDYAKERAEGLSAALTLVGWSKAMDLAPDYAKALAYMQDAVGYGDRYFHRRTIKTSEAGSGELEKAKPGNDEWVKLRPELLARIRWLERQLRIAKWGLDYVLYLEAQEARKAADPLALDFSNVGRIYPKAAQGSPPSPGADYRKALETYDLIISNYSESVFGEAGRLYRWVCLAKLGRTEEALKGLEALCQKNPNGLYQGEAFKLLGDLWLQDRWDGVKAAIYYQKAVDWCKNARALTESLRLFALPEKCRAPATPPGEWQKMDEAGVIAYSVVPPGAVVNRLTTPWYLNRLEEDAEFALGFLRSAANDWEGALGHYQRALELDPLLQVAEKNQYYNTLRRLRGACAKRAYVGEREENADLRGEVRTAILWADFIYLRMYFQQAESLYARLYQAAGEQKDGKLAARAGIGLILVAEQRNDNVKALKLADEIAHKWPQAPATPYALYMKGLACDSGPDCDYPEAVKCFRELYTRYPDSPLAEAARFEEIFRGINSRNLEQRRSWIEKFKRDYPRSKYLEPLDAYIRLLEKWAAEDKIRVEKRAAEAGNKIPENKPDAPRK